MIDEKQAGVAKPIALLTAKGLGANGVWYKSFQPV
jgi:hypothetical protein